MPAWFSAKLEGFPGFPSLYGLSRSEDQLKEAGMARPRSFVLAAVAGAVAATLVGGIAWAAIPSGGVYTACMLKNVGTVRLIDKSLPPNNLMGHCKPTLETEVSWSQQGAQGIQGVPGTNGTNGTNGIDGDDGAPGGTTTYVREWAPFGAPDFGPDGLFNPGEVVSGTANCDDLNDQVTGAGISSIQWTSGSGAPGFFVGSVLPLSATPTHKEGADFTVANNSSDDFFRFGSGWIICTVVD